MFPIPGAGEDAERPRTCREEGQPQDPLACGLASRSCRGVDAAGGDPKERDEKVKVAAWLDLQLEIQDGRISCAK